MKNLVNILIASFFSDYDSDDDTRTVFGYRT